MTHIPRTGRHIITLLTMAIPLLGAHADARGLALAVQPILSEQATAKAFAPLARYIGQVLKKPCRVATNPNFLAYWQMIHKAHGYAFILDAAHFTDYRLTHLGYRLIAKQPGTVSYSLVVRSSEMILGPSDLIGRRVASFGSPGMGAALLNQLFPHPTRQPIIIAITSAASGLRLLAAHKVAAAMLPTPLVGEQMAAGAAITVVTTTAPIPNVALSAAPWLPPASRALVRQAILHAPPALLRAIGLKPFVPAKRLQYRHQDQILKTYWGY